VYEIFYKEHILIKTLLINPITKQTTEAFVDARSLEQLYEFNGTRNFSIPLILTNGDSLIWHVENKVKKEGYNFFGLKEKIMSLNLFKK
jgi:hypothetical protein